MLNRNELFRNHVAAMHSSPTISQTVQLSQTTDDHPPPPQHSASSLRDPRDSDSYHPGHPPKPEQKSQPSPPNQASIQVRLPAENSYESFSENHESGLNTIAYPLLSNDYRSDQLSIAIYNNNNNNNSQNSFRNNSHSHQSVVVAANSSMVDAENRYDEYDDEGAFEMSKLFLSIYKENSQFLIMMMVSNAVMGSVAWYLSLTRCKPDEESSLEYWNKQWMWYFFAKVVYHLCIYAQMYSPALKQTACDTLGEYRSQIENYERELEFESMTEGQKHQTRQILEKQLLDFLYRRTFFLKIVFLLKLLVSLFYIIYGLFVFFNGNFFLVLTSNANPVVSCQYYLTLWLYLSTIIVISCNREIFDLVIILTIFIIYFPYMIFKRCKLNKDRNRVFKQFVNLKYAEGKVEGDAECAICRMEYVAKEKIIILPCNTMHHFHKECITSWLNVNMTCPLCRYNLADPLEEPLLAQNDNPELLQSQNAHHQQPNYNQMQYAPPNFHIPQRANQNGRNPHESIDDEEEEEEDHEGSGDHREDMLAGADDRVMNEEEEEILLIQSFCAIFATENLLLEFLATSEYSNDLKAHIIEIYRSQQQQQHQQPLHEQESN